MTWTKETPLMSGCYWQRYGNGPVKMVEVEGERVFFFNDERSLGIRYFSDSWWCGPLKPPAINGECE